MKIIVYAICKNEEKNIDLWYESMKEADEIYLLDTGSTDKTVEIFKSLPKVHISQKIIDPWRFDVARNESLELVPKDKDLICVCTDIDERFLPGWRKKLEEAWTPETTRAEYMYNWALNEDGTPKVCFYLNKIHQRFGYEWHHAIHEVVEPVDVEEKVTKVDITLNHYQDMEKNREMYLTILEKSVEQNPEDSRDTYCLAREYRAYCRHHDAIRVFHDYIKNKNATWDQERSTAMRLMALSYRDLGYYEEEELWLKKAHEETPEVREPLYELGVLYITQEKFDLAYKYLTKALSKGQNTHYLNEEDAWDGSIYDHLSIASFMIGKYKQSLKYIKEAMKHFPNDQRLKDNHDMIVKVIKDNKANKR